MLYLAIDATSHHLPPPNNCGGWWFARMINGYRIPGTGFEEWEYYNAAPGELPIIRQALGTCEVVILKQEERRNGCDRYLLLTTLHLDQPKFIPTIIII